MSVSLFLCCNLEDLVELRLLQRIVGIVLISKPTRKCLVCDVLELGHIEVQFLQVGVLLVVRYNDHPEDVVQ